MLNLFCNPKIDITCWQGVKVIFSSIDSVFNPLSLTRAGFKRQVLDMKTEVEQIKTTSLQQELRMRGVVAKCKILEIQMKRYINDESKTTITNEDQYSEEETFQRMIQREQKPHQKD